MARRRWAWTEKQQQRLQDVQAIIADLEAYLPLTLRQVFYQLVASEKVENSKSAYTGLSKLLKWARIDGLIPWEALQDRGRIFHDLTGWADRGDFAEAQLDDFLQGYRRDLLQTQDVYLEAWIEKDALASIFTREALPYSVPVVVCRGFSSVSFLHDFKERLAYIGDRRPVMLYFGDFDPSGVEMLKAMETTLQDELAAGGVEFKRIALLPDDIRRYRLPHNPDAIKEKDSRTQKHLEAYGALAVELDALRPDLLARKIRQAIDAELDLDALETERQQQADDLDKLEQLRADVIGYMDGKA